VDGEALESACMQILVSTGEPVKKGRASKTCYLLPRPHYPRDPIDGSARWQRAPSSILIIFAFSKEESCGGKKGRC
jgi:hypothetical protein